MIKNLPTAGRGGSRCEYLERCCGFLGVFSLSVSCDGAESGGRGKGDSPERKRKKKNIIQNLKQEEEKRYDSPGEKNHPHN
jgi:hypothetical protein